MYAYIIFFLILLTCFYSKGILKNIYLKNKSKTRITFLEEIYIVNNKPKKKSSSIRSFSFMEIFFGCDRSVSFFMV